jgi:hypothetical protein
MEDFGFFSGRMDQNKPVHEINVWLQIVLFAREAFGNQIAV